MRDRVFGAVLVAYHASPGYSAAGARGGYISFLIATALFVVLWSVRQTRFDRNSLGPAFVGLAGFLGFAFVIFLIIFWKRAHNIVLGGGMEAYSDQGRSTEWAMGWPKILANPITGHGFLHGRRGSWLLCAGGSEVPTVDSYPLSLLVETGVPGFLFFLGMVVFAAWLSLRQFLLDASQAGALAGALGCSVVAFGFYRAFLSQRENHMLFFIIIACIMFLNHYYLQRLGKTVRNC